MASAAKNYRDMCIAISGLHTGENPQPGVPVIWSLRQGGYEGKIVGLVYDANEAGIWAGVADEVFEIPYPSDGSEAFLSRLNYIRQSHPLKVIMPTLDSEIMAYLRLAPKLAEMGIKTFLPTEEQFKLRSKNKLSELGKLKKIRIPASLNLSDAAMVWKLADSFSFPVMIKGPFYDAYKASTPEEAEKFFHKIRAEWGLPVIVQEFLAGDEYNMVAVGDGKGGCIGSISMRKTLVTAKGKAFGGVLVEDPELNAFGRDVIKKLSWRGPLELEVLKAQRDGAYYLIEINPRFPAWVRFATEAGQNLPLAVLKLALGEKQPRLRSHRKGLFFIRHSVDVVGDISHFGELSSTGELRNISMLLNQIQSNGRDQKALRKAAH